jgi:hypothetical protein
VKAITCLLNERGIRTPNGGRWGLAQIHTILTRTTYIGEHRFNRLEARTKQRKAKTEHAIMSVPPLIAEHDFNEVQRLLRSRNSKMIHPQAVGGPILLTGICFCMSCGGAMTIRTGPAALGYPIATTPARPERGRVEQDARDRRSGWIGWMTP